MSCKSWLHYFKIYATILTYKLGFYEFEPQTMLSEIYAINLNYDLLNQITNYGFSN